MLMDIQRQITAGAPGTKKYLREYGDRLVCVRYKYDKARGKKLKTVEIVVSEEPWTPRRGYVPMNKKVNVRILAHEKRLQHIVRSAGGRWLSDKLRWRLPYGTAKSLGLEEWIDWSS
jgi:hypothetical protein